MTKLSCEAPTIAPLFSSSVSGLPGFCSVLPCQQDPHESRRLVVLALCAEQRAVLLVPVLGMAEKPHAVHAGLVVSASAVRQLSAADTAAVELQLAHFCVLVGQSSAVLLDAGVPEGRVHMLSKVMLHLLCLSERPAYLVMISCLIA